MTDSQRNSGAEEQAEQNASRRSQSAKMNGPTESIDLSVAQRAEIWKRLGNQPTESAPAGFEPKVGAAVPNQLRLKSLARDVSSQVPAVQSCEYPMVHSQLFLVDPSTEKIVAIITE